MAWLLLFVLFYTMLTLYWARAGAVANGDYHTYFSAGHDLAPWLSALVLGGSSLSAFALVGGASEITRHGFSAPAVMQFGVALALPGVFFFKPLWLAAQRLRVSSQAEILRSYYQSEFLVAVSTVIGLLFAVAFAGLQMNVMGQLVTVLSDGGIDKPVAIAVITLIVAGYVVIGGMRTIGWLGAIQTVALAGAMSGLVAFVLIRTGGLGALSAALLARAGEAGDAGLFSVDGVIRFSAGIGATFAAGGEGTSVFNLSLFLAFLGMQASPLAAKVVLSTRSPLGLAAGQTWVVAGAFGVLCAFGVTAVGAAALVDERFTLSNLMRDLSPWFSAWVFVGLLAGAQLIAGLGLLTAGEALVRHIYKPWFHSDLGRRDTVTVTRIAIAVMAVISALMAVLAPVTLSALGALALPLAFQLWMPLLGVTRLRWITRPAAVTGTGFGIIGVLLTEPFGIAVLSYFGLDLPWGRWPWTIHSAAWGMVPNLVAVLLISAFTQRRTLGREAQEIRRLLDLVSTGKARARALRTTAWSVVLAWLFLAVGPGLVFGNAAFVGQSGKWLVGVPSLWGWGLLFWALGLGIVWFLSYKMEMASAARTEISSIEPELRLRKDHRRTEAARLRALAVVVGVGFVLAVVMAFGFGR